MRLFKKKNAQAPELVSMGRGCCESFGLPAAVQPFEKELYDRLRCAVPIIDAAIMKIIRLTGGFRVICSDEAYQQELSESESEDQSETEDEDLPFDEDESAGFAPAM